MKATVSKIAGIDDAILAFSYSKRTISQARRDEIRDLCQVVNDENGFMRERGGLNGRSIERYNTELLKLIKYGVAHDHGTLLSFIDLSIEIDGLHRGGQDDWDAHAYRFHNRIVRSSTRLAKFTGAEKSEYYNGKVLTTEEVLGALDMNIGDVTLDGVNYNYVEGIGFVREDLMDEQDVVRGLYRLEMPCSSTTKINYRELRHVYKMRNEKTHAHPEVQAVVEQVREELRVKQPILGDMLGKVWAANMVKSGGGGFGASVEYGYVEQTDAVLVSKGILNGMLEVWDK